MSQAQTRKGSAKKALSYLEAQDYAMAEEEIDAAVAYELEKLKKKGKPEVVKTKTLRAQAQVYAGLAGREDISEEEVEKYIGKTIAVYDQIKAQEEEGSKTYEEIFNSEAPSNLMKMQRSEYDQFYDIFWNRGVPAWEGQDYEMAYDNFEKAYRIKGDTLTGKLAFYSAAFVHDEKESEETEKNLVAIIEELKKTPYDTSDVQLYLQHVRVVAKKAEPFEEVISDNAYELNPSKRQIKPLEEKYKTAKDRADANKRYKSSSAQARYRKYNKQATQYKKELDELTAKVAKMESDNAEARAEANKIYEECLVIVKEGAEKYPDNEVLSSQLITYYAKLDRLDDAVASIEAQLEKNPNDERLNFNLAVLYDQMSDKAEDEAAKKEYYDKAVAQYNRLLEVSPEHVDGMFNLGALYYNSARKINSKKEDLPRTATGSFKDAKKAKAYEAQINDLATKAEEVAKKVVELDADNSRNWNLLAQIYSLQKKYDDAEAAMKKADALN
ncbi:hypothetical protein GCM10023331_16480 [Algivirga pacifica]|uniref:Tetratricopeptide repeat-containing protein n=2 Tax=Algivirga pacifica TaxID=1162670 RepID=A0ABP9DAL1_9BACT